MYFKILQTVSGIFQIIYGIIFFSMGVWYVYPTSLSRSSTSNFDIINCDFASLLLVSSIISLYSGLAIFINYKAGFKISVFVLFINALGDLWQGKVLHSVSLEYSIFYFVLGIISILLAVLLALYSMNEPED